MGGIKSRNGPITALGGINRYYYIYTIIFCLLFFFYLGYVKFMSYFLAPVEDLFTDPFTKKISGKRTLPIFSFNCWFSVSCHSK